MTSATVRVSKPAKRATPWSSCTTMSPVRSSVNERSAPRRAPPTPPRRPRRPRRRARPGAGAAAGARGTPRASAAARRSPRAATPRRSAATAPAAGSGSSDRLGAPARPRRATSLSGARGCTPRARPRRGAETRRPCGSPSARASRAPARLRASERAAVSADCARSSISWPLESADSQMRARSASVARMLCGLTYRWCASSSPNAAQTSLQWSPSTGSRSSSAATTSSRVRRRPGRAARRSARPAAARRCPGAPRPRRRPPRRRRRRRRHLLDGDLGELAVLERELRRGRDLDLLDVPQRALRERREPAQRLDLHVEHVDAHRALLGRREHVQQAAAHRELPALLDLVDALVARAHELRRALVEVQQLAHAQRERARAQLRVGHLLRQRHRAHHHHRLLSAAAPAPAPRLAPSSASSAATRRPTRCAGGARCDS